MARRLITYSIFTIKNLSSKTTISANKISSSTSDPLIEKSTTEGTPDDHYEKRGPPTPNSIRGQVVGETKDSKEILTYLQFPIQKLNIKTQFLREFSFF